MTPQQRSKMFADKVHQVKELTIKLFQAKNHEEILKIAEEDPIAFNSLGEYDKLEEYLPYLKDNYGITPTDDLLKDMAFIKDTAVDASKYQNEIGMMADPLYLELKDLNDFYKYEDFVEATTSLDNHIDFDDQPAFEELDYGSELQSFIGQDLAFVFFEDSKKQSALSMMKVFNEVYHV